VWTKRRYPRYQVDNYPELAAKITEYPEIERLRQIGQGGCSFIGASALAQSRPGKIVNCRFKLVSIPSGIFVPGKLVHCTPMEEEGQNVYIFGIEFLSSHQRLVEPIIQKLEILAKAGKISVVHPIDEQEIE
jgi:hypothetical protein